MKMNDIGRYRVLDRDTVKYLALILMFFGHTIAWLQLMKYPEDQFAVYELPTALLILTGLSLFCPPVMFFFVADGCKYTRNRKKYAFRLLIFACITQPFDWLIFQPIYGWQTSNVMFTLFFGLLALICWESKFRRWQRVTLVILCIAATALLNSDWLVTGVLFILILHIYCDRPRARFTAYTSLSLLHCLLNLTSLGKVPAFKLNFVYDRYVCGIYGGLSVYDGILQRQKRQTSRICKMVFLYLLSCSLSDDICC